MSCIDGDFQSFEVNLRVYGFSQLYEPAGYHRFIGGWIPFEDTGIPLAIRRRLTQFCYDY